MRSFALIKPLVFLVLWLFADSDVVDAAKSIFGCQAFAVVVV